MNIKRKKSQNILFICHIGVRVGYAKKKLKREGNEKKVYERKQRRKGLRMNEQWINLYELNTKVDS